MRDPIESNTSLNRSRNEKVMNIGRLRYNDGKSPNKLKKIGFGRLKGFEVELRLVLHRIFRFLNFQRKELALNRGKNTDFLIVN